MVKKSEDGVVGKMSNKYLYNRIANCSNSYQGKYKRVLAVCSAGLLRSPTTAFVLSQPPYNYNTRAAGINEDFALIPVDEVLLEWADEIVCMNKEQQIRLEKMLGDKKKPIQNLEIDDCYEYRSPKLIKLIKKNYKRNEENNKS